MNTTIQISKELKEELAARKIERTDTYEDIIRDLLEDTMELSAATKRAIESARMEAKAGSTVPFDAVMKKAGI